MKKRLFFQAVVLAGLVFVQKAQAQNEDVAAASGPVGYDLQKGKWAVSLNGILTVPKYDRVEQRNAFLTPQLGYLLARNWVGGIQLSSSMYIGKPKAEVPNSASVQDFRVYSVAPELYTRYYLFSARFRPFVQLSSGYSFQWGRKNAATTFFDAADTQDFVASGALGVSVLVGRRVRLEGLYNQRLVKGAQVDYPGNLQNFRLGVSVTVK